MTWSGRTLPILKFYAWVHIMTFVGVLVTVKRMPISTDPQNVDPGVFYGESSLRISHILWLLSANVPQVEMLPQKPGPYQGAGVNCYKVYLRPQSTASPWMRRRASHHKTSSVLEENMCLQEEKKSLANFLALKTPHSGQGGSVVGKGHIWGLRCLWKKNFISLDSQRWLPAKQASEKLMCVWKLHKCIHLKIEGKNT